MRFRIWNEPPNIIPINNNVTNLLKRHFSLWQTVPLSFISFGEANCYQTFCETKMLEHISFAGLNFIFSPILLCIPCMLFNVAASGHIYVLVHISSCRASCKWTHTFNSTNLLLRVGITHIFFPRELEGTHYMWPFPLLDNKRRMFHVCICIIWSFLQSNI